MSVTYVKRYRMEINLRGRWFDRIEVPPGYRLIPWDASLLEAHAATKYECFRGEIDANLFSCLGEYEGCFQLMEKMTHKHEFLPEATWLLEFVGEDKCRPEHCGTIQGIRSNSRYGTIQNVGITPCHRGRGLATQLLDVALAGFQQVGLRRVSLNVTAQNESAVALYRHYGFRRVKTLYRSVEVVMA